jgi:ferredoxin
MTTIRFTSLGVDAKVTVDVGEGERRTLLSIAKEHGIPVPFRCEAGDCSACLVHVDTLSGGRRPVARLTEKESVLLQAMYLLNQHDIEMPSGGAYLRTFGSPVITRFTMRRSLCFLRATRAGDSCRQQKCRSLRGR